VSGGPRIYQPGHETKKAQSLNALKLKIVEMQLTMTTMLIRLGGTFTATKAEVEEAFRCGMETTKNGMESVTITLKRGTVPPEESKLC